MMLFGVIAAPDTAATDATLRSLFARTAFGAEDRVLLANMAAGYVPPAECAGERLTVLPDRGARSWAAAANELLAAAREAGAGLVLLRAPLLFTDGWLEPLLVPHRAVLSSVSNVDVSHTVGDWSVGPDLDLADCAGREAELATIAAHHRQVARSAREVAAWVPFACVRIPQAVQRAVGDFDVRFSGDAAAKDYALRVWRAGIRLERALGSFVLRLRTAPAAPEARNADEAAFGEKWGPALTYAFIGEDWNLFRTDPALAPLIAQQQYRPVVEHLAAHPDLAPFIARQQRATVAAVCCIYDDDSWLALAVDSVYAACESIWFLVSDRPWNGEASDQDPLIARIEGLPDPAGKIRIVRGSWATQAEQRNDGLRRLAEAGIDYCLVLDADEIYEPEPLERLLGLVRANPQIDCWRLYCWTYWKSSRYRIDPPQNYAAAAVVRVGVGQFVENRNYRGPREHIVPPATAMFHHMSYARTDDQILRKITTFGDASRVQPGWFEQVWKAWDANRALENLNPCYPGAYRRAVEQPREAVPPVLRPIWDRDGA